MGGHVIQSKSSVSQMARGRCVQTADQIEHRGFARAIGPDQGEHFTLPHIETDFVHGQHTAEANAQFVGAEENVAHLSRSDF